MAKAKLVGSVCDWSPARQRAFADILIALTKLGPDQCWPWPRVGPKHGYGMWWNGADEVLAHRTVWRHFKGSFDPALMVLHRCDNPPCVNPDHLFLGTQRDNIHDAIKKGRHSCPPSGEAHHSAKINRAIAAEIRQSPLSLGKAAICFGVSKKLVLLIRQERIWRNENSNSNQ